jgi:hypothetical protein
LSWTGRRRSASVRIRYPGIYRSQFLDLIGSFQDIALDAQGAQLDCTDCIGRVLTLRV